MARRGVNCDVCSGPQPYEFTSSYGRQSHLTPGITYSRTPSRWAIPDGGPIVRVPGSSDARWL